jgi:hypothetical protein
MDANLLDTEIRKYLSLLGNKEKKSLLEVIKSLLHITNNDKENRKPANTSSSVDYNKYQFPESSIKFNRDEINER